MLVRIIKFLILGISAMILSSCMPQSEKFAQMTPAEISNWSDKELCTNGYRNNRAIRSELIKRKLLTEVEYEYIMMSNEHHNFPRKGMPRCAMWTFSNSSEIIDRTIQHDGTVKEVWKVHRGEYIFSTSLGGFFYLITIEDGRITDVSGPLAKY